MNTHGVWSATVKKDWMGEPTNFVCIMRKASIRIQETPTVLPLSLDNKKSLVVNPKRLVPRGYEKVTKQKASWRKANACSSVICEMHLRDFSISETSGVKKSYRGTYLGACQKGTRNAHGDVTCFDLPQNVWATTMSNCNRSLITINLR